MAANNVYFPNIDRALKASGSNYLLIDNKTTGLPLKISLDDFVVSLNTLQLQSDPLEGWKSKTQVISSESLLSIEENPVELLPNLPSNKFYDFRVWATLNYNSIIYANKAGLLIKHKSSTHILHSGWVIKPQSSTIKAVSFSIIGDTITNNLVLTAYDDLIFGDSTITLYIEYRVVTLS
jgi:hypothetical protein